MTALLLEATSFTQTIAQGVPLMKGRALYAYGHEIPVHGVVTAAGSGEASVGMRCEADGQYACCGINYQFPHFEASGSGCEFGPGIDFYATVNGATSIFLNQLSVDFFGCGQFGVQERDNPSVNLEGLMLLSGMTLETQTGYLTNPGSGNIDVTGLPFRPDLVLFSYFGRDVFGEPIVAFGQRGTLSFGAFDGTNQWAFAEQSGGYLVGGGRSSQASASHVVLDNNGNNISAVSLNSDGFTLNWAGANPNIVQWYAIHDPAGQFAVGMGTEGDSSFSPGFPPEAMMFANSGVSVLDTNQTGCSMGFGGCDGLLRQYAGWGGGGANEQNLGYWNTSAIAMMKHPNVGIPANNAEAVVTAINPTDVDLSWIVGGGGGLKFGWIAMLLSDAAGFDGCGFTPQIYRWIQ